MRYIHFVFYFLLPYSLTSIAEDVTWRSECVGYYTLQLPNKLESGRYPTERIVIGKYDIKPIFGKFYKNIPEKNIIGQYSNFYYKNYSIMVSEKKDINITKYQEEIKDLFSEYNSITYNIKNYSPSVFFLTSKKSHSLYINKENRLYQFMRINPGAGIEKNAKKAINVDEEVDIHSLLSHFHTRELYEIPSRQGVCFPYGFIDSTTGKTERDMSVTYRMMDHPDVMILFEDASYHLRVPLDGFEPVKNYDAKYYAKWLWNNVYMLYPGQERKLLWPRWFTVTIDGKKGSGSFLQVTKHNGEKDYGYLAFVRGNPDNPIEEPDLQVFVTSFSDISEGRPRMTPDELKELAEHIVSSVKHR
jgi:hypothetical protein